MSYDSLIDSLLKRGGASEDTRRRYVVNHSFSSGAAEYLADLAEQEFMAMETGSKAPSCPLGFLTIESASTLLGCGPRDVLMLIEFLTRFIPSAHNSIYNDGTFTDKEILAQTAEMQLNFDANELPPSTMPLNQRSSSREMHDLVQHIWWYACQNRVSRCLSLIGVAMNVRRTTKQRATNNSNSDDTNNQENDDGGGGGGGGSGTISTVQLLSRGRPMNHESVYTLRQDLTRLLAFPSSFPVPHKAFQKTSAIDFQGLLDASIDRLAGLLSFYLSENGPVCRLQELRSAESQDGKTQDKETKCKPEFEREKLLEAWESVDANPVHVSGESFMVPFEVSFEANMAHRTISYPHPSLTLKTAAHQVEFALRHGHPVVSCTKHTESKNTTSENNGGGGGGGSGGGGNGNSTSKSGQSIENRADSMNLAGSWVKLFNMCSSVMCHEMVHCVQHSWQQKDQDRPKYGGGISWQAEHDASVLSSPLFWGLLYMFYPENPWWEVVGSSKDDGTSTQSTGTYNPLYQPMPVWYKGKQYKFKQTRAETLSNSYLLDAPQIWSRMLMWLENSHWKAKRWPTGALNEYMTLRDSFGLQSPNMFAIRASCLMAYLRAHSEGTLMNLTSNTQIPKDSTQLHPYDKHVATIVHLYTEAAKSDGKWLVCDHHTNINKNSSGSDEKQHIDDKIHEKDALHFVEGCDVCKCVYWELDWQENSKTHRLGAHSDAQWASFDARWASSIKGMLESEWPAWTSDQFVNFLNVCFARDRVGDVHKSPLAPVKVHESVKSRAFDDYQQWS